MRLTQQQQECINKALADGRAIDTTPRPVVAESPDQEKLSEKAFMADVVKFAKGKGWKVYHVHFSQKAAPGFPDLLMLRGVIQVVAELKVGKNKPTEEQEDWLFAFGAIPGCRSYTWYPKDWKLIEEALR